MKRYGMERRQHMKKKIKDQEFISTFKPIFLNNSKIKFQIDDLRNYFHCTANNKTFWVMACNYIFISAWNIENKYHCESNVRRVIVDAQLGVIFHMVFKGNILRICNIHWARARFLLICRLNHFRKFTTEQIFVLSFFRRQLS